MPNDRPRSDLVTVVPLGQIATTCVIAMPFDTRFDRVFAAIERAANAQNLKPWRADTNKTGAPFWDAIQEHIRTATIFVADCTLEGDVPNPNVMCELGYALALGKSALILTADTESLPANIRHFQCCNYDPNADKQTLAEHFEIRMRQILDACPEGLPSRPDSDGIRITQAVHLRLLDPEFWTQFRVVFTYANKVRTEMEALGRNYGNELARRAKVTLDHPEEACSLEDLKEEWGEYRDHFERVTRAVIRRPQELRVALQVIETIRNGPATNNQVIRIDNFFSAVRSQILLLEKSYEEAVQAMKSLSDNFDQETLVDLVVLIGDLVSKMKGLIDDSNGLVKNLVDLVTEGFPPPGASHEERHPQEGEPGRSLGQSH